MVSFAIGTTDAANPFSAKRSLAVLLRQLERQFLNQTKDPRLSMLQKFADAMKISLAELVK